MSSVGHYVDFSKKPRYRRGSMPDNFYLLVVHDRHCDDEYYLFFDKEPAIKKAKQLAKLYAGDSEEYPEEEIIEAWEYFAKYSCEDDYVKVVKIVKEGIDG